jgi:polyhydroxyalkanoate synthesis regulator phasin
MNQEKSRRLIDTLVKRLDTARKKSKEYEEQLRDLLTRKNIEERSLPGIKKRLEMQAQLSKGLPIDINNLIN